MPVNRFTNLTPSAYKPMTSQEIMLVPLAMREQHNKTQDAIQTQMAELDKIRALPVHTEEAMVRKNQLIQNIDALSSDLANQGFSNDMTSKLIQLNRNIKDEFSPTGRLGKISGAYDTYFKEMEAFKKDNADKTWSQDEFNIHWGEHMNAYQGYDEKGDIINIGSLSAPEKVAIADRFQKLKSIMGDANLAYKTLTGRTTWRTGVNGEMYSRDGETGDEIKYNNPQVVGILKEVLNELNDPTSDLSKSRVYSGRSIEQALEESGNLAKSMVNVEKGYTNKSKEDVHGYVNANEAAAQEGALTLLDTTQTGEDYEGTIGEAIATINKYTTNPPKTNDERLDYQQALKQKQAFDQNIKDVNIGDKLTKSNGKTLAQHYATELGLPAGKRVNFNYVENLYNKASNNFLSKFKKGTKEYALAEAHLNGDPNNLIMKNIATGGGASSKTKELEKVSNLFNQLVKKKQEVYSNYKNDIFKSSNTYSDWYTPHFEGKEDNNAKAAFKDLNTKLTNSLSDMISNPQGGAFISDISTEDGKNVRLNSKNIIGKRENINKYILNNMKDVELVAVSPSGGKGVLPSVRLKINLKDDAESGVNIYEAFGDEMGGKTMFVNMIIPDVTSVTEGNMGTNSIYQQIFNAIGKYGDTPSKLVATKARQNQKKHGR